MPNRSLRDERQHVRDDGRPRVGPADPATVRRMLDQRLNEREPNIYGKGETKPKPKESLPIENPGVSVPKAINAIKDKKYKDRKLTDEA